MTLVAFLVAIAAIALVCAGYYFSIRRLFELPLDGIELHPIYTSDGWRILLYRHRRGTSNGEPVLLCHGYCSNHWNLTVPRGESLADYLAEAGYDCWAIDLRGSRSSMPPAGTPRHRATFDGYVMQDIPAALDYIRSVTGHDQAHWVGHSLGGTLLYAYELVHGGARIASGTTIASPPVLRPGWSRWQSRLIHALETAPGAVSVIQRGIAPIHAFLKPRTEMVPIDWDNLNPRFGIAEFFSAVETPPGPVTRSLEECARHRYLAVDNDRVNVLAGLNRLETPQLVFSCPLDPIVPAEVIREFFDRLPGSDKKYVELSRANGCERDYDHIDPPFARHAATDVFAHITEWLSAHPMRRVELPEPVISRAPAREPVIEPVRVEAAPQALRADAGTGVRTFASVQTRTEAGVSALETHTAPLWGRALENAATMIDGLDAGSVRQREKASKPAKSRSKRRGTAMAAKQTMASKGRAPATAKKKRSAASAFEKPSAWPDGQKDAATKTSKKKKKNKPTTAAKLAKAEADSIKKDKKKKKTKEKKKTKGKKSSRK
jgi:pimeloyl-ACP methyl ester carboxylesterase